MKLPYNEEEVDEISITEYLGRAQTAETKKKISKAMSGNGNSQYKDGRRLDYRKKLGLKKGDKRIVDHKNNDRWDNKKSNLKIMSRSEHDKKHLRQENTKGGNGRQPPRRIAKRAKNK